MFDDALLLGVATQDPTLKLTNDRFLNVPWGIGIRKGVRRDPPAGRTRPSSGCGRTTSSPRSSSTTRPARFVSSFLDNVPRPGNSFSYPVGKDPTAICP